MWFKCLLRARARALAAAAFLLLGSSAAGSAAAPRVGTHTELPRATATPAAFELPDLALASVSAPASVQVGQTLQVSESTANKGRGTAGASSTAVYLSRNATKDGGDVLVATVAVPRLPAGRSSAGSKSARVPKTKAGIYYVVFCADDRKKVRESNEKNNCASSPRQVFVLPTSFRGEVKGTRDGGGWTETWTGTVIFEIRHEERDIYGPGSVSGSVTYSLSGTYDGCAITGGGAIPLKPDDGTLRLFVEGGSLKAQGGGGHPFRTSYPFSTGAPCNQQGGWFPRWWLRTQAEVTAKVTSEGIVLDGSFTEEGSTFTWHLVGS